jgi:hypothetical protein
LHEQKAAESIFSSRGASNVVIPDVSSRQDEFDRKLDEVGMCADQRHSRSVYERVYRDCCIPARPTGGSSLPARVKVSTDATPRLLTQIQSNSVHPRATPLAEWPQTTDCPLFAKIPAVMTLSVLGSGSRQVWVWGLRGWRDRRGKQRPRSSASNSTR